MDKRLSIRPQIETINWDVNSSDIEFFQNQTLRPIIKMQNDLLLEFFKDHSLSRKINLEELTEIKRNEFVSASLNKDSKLKLSLNHLIIGQFSVNEFEVYKLNKSEFNKRIIKMIEQRLIDQLK